MSRPLSPWTGIRAYFVEPVRKLLPVLLGAWLIAGCSTLGPQSVPRDRFDYNTAISDSWKEQTLLNIVKLRYADMPLFVEVASVVSGYTLESTLSLAGTLATDSAVTGDALNLGAGGKYTDRPTITYAPITGQQFNKSFMTPIPPRAVLFLMQSGWAADLILPITVDSINGRRSRIAAGVNQRGGDSGFYRVIELMREIQKSGAVGMQILRSGEAGETTVLFFHRDNVGPEVDAAVSELDRLLGLRPGTRETQVVYGLLPKSDTELAMLTRSMLQIMIDFATQIEVPLEHVQEGRTVPSLEKGDGLSRLIEIRHSKEPPESAFTAVKYRDYWFWIDDRDFASKRTFAFLMILFSLTETGAKEGLPLVTIPAS